MQEESYKSTNYVHLNQKQLKNHLFSHMILLFHNRINQNDTYLLSQQIFIRVVQMHQDDPPTHWQIELKFKDKEPKALTLERIDWETLKDIISKQYELTNLTQLHLIATDQSHLWVSQKTSQSTLLEFLNKIKTPKTLEIIVKNVLTRKVPSQTKIDLPLQEYMKSQQYKNLGQKNIKKFKEQTIDLSSKIIMKNFQEFDRDCPMENPLHSFLMGLYNSQQEKINEQYIERIKGLDKFQGSFAEENKLKPWSNQLEIIVPNLVIPEQKQGIFEGISSFFMKTCNSAKCSIQALYKFTTGQLTSEQLSNLVGRKFSEDQYLRFIKKSMEEYLKYKSLGDVDSYDPPPEDRDDTILTFEDDDVIGILGDWGTYQRDATDILRHLVKEQGANIIIHLGDTYYAGFPKEFEKVEKQLEQVRLELGEQRNFRYYTIAGNHDYYTFGRPFHQHISKNNLPHEEYRQKHAYFCLRNRSQTVQFIGLNTGKGDCQFINAVNPYFNGIRLNEAEVRWAIRKINEMHQRGGKTVLLTHHPMFSTFEQILGNWTETNRYTSNVDPKLARDLFEILPKVTVWFWGHEHRFSTFKANSFGVNQCVLLGNSAIQVKLPNHHNVPPRFDCGGITETLFHPEVGNSPTDNNFQNHTAAVLQNFVQNGNEPSDAILAKYIYMTSSYQLRSQLVRSEFVSFQPPNHQNIKFNEQYHILEQTGLSMTVDQSQTQLMLDCTPALFQIVPVDNLQNQEVYPDRIVMIKHVITQKRIYFDQNESLVKLGIYEDLTQQQHDERRRYHWQLVAERVLQTGTIFKIRSVHANQTIRRQFTDGMNLLFGRQNLEGSRFYFYQKHRQNVRRLQHQ